MELHEFTRKFLPDYDVRLSNYRVSYFRDNPIGWHKSGIKLFCRSNFPEALKNFADMICKKQRGNCYLNSRIVEIIVDEHVIRYISGESVMGAKQPEIDGL